MPNTLVREGYLDSDRISSLCDFDDRVFFRLLLAADDAGRTDGRVDKLRSALFPTRETVRGTDVEKAVVRLIDAQLVTRWEWDTKPILQVMRWQRRSGAQFSKFPDTQGSFRIEWVNVDTRDGVKAFASTSMVKGLRRVTEPIGNPFGGDSEKSTYTKTDTETDTESKSDTPHKPPKGGRPRARSPALPPGLVRFWEAYPSPGRNRSSQKECLSQWTKLRLEPLADEVLAGLAAWVRCHDWTKDGGQFVPGAHRFLKNEKWRLKPFSTHGPPDGEVLTHNMDDEELRIASYGGDDDE